MVEKGGKSSHFFSHLKKTNIKKLVAVVGTAGAIVGGWGNLGGGLTHIAMVSKKSFVFLSLFGASFSV